MTTMLAIAACSGSGHHASDATGDTHAADAVADTAVSLDAFTPCEVVFLEFDAITLFGNFDDATQNRSAATTLINRASFDVDAYRPSDATRDFKIQTITAQIANQLAPYRIQVTTIRPARGPYKMVTFGAAPLLAAFSNGLATGACGTPNLKGVAFVFGEQVEANAGAVGASAVMAVTLIGYMAGIPMSTAAGDCMCEGSSCTAGSTCTIGGASTPINGTVCGGGTFDEQAAFAAIPCP